MILRTLIFINSLLLFFTFGDQLFFLEKTNTPTKQVTQLPTIMASSGGFCGGILGENIFTDGDFGSGFTTNLPADPSGYAPSYTYQSNPPPNDGYYTITNNTSNWGAFAATSWVNTGDNSTDPNGYMMVINADYDPGIFYQKTIEGLCENTLYQFSADVLNLLLSGGIKPNIDFLIDGVVQYSTGDVPVNQQWNTYGFTFTTAPGTSSLTLAIRNNAPGGNGNDLAIDNISFRACGPALTVFTTVPFICEGIAVTIEAYLNGNEYDTPFFQWQISTDGGGIWNDLMGENTQSLSVATPVDGDQYRLMVSNSAATIDNPKCRIISNAQEIVISPVDFIVFDTLCQGLELQVGNSVYNSPGIYVDSFLTSYGCDSIVTTNLEIVPDFGITADFELKNPDCAGDQNGAITISNVQNGSGDYQFQWNNDPFQDQPKFEFLPAGIQQITIRDSYECESIFEIDLVDPQEILIDLGEDVTIQLGEEYEMSPFANFQVESFVWLETSGLVCTNNCLYPTVAPFETTTYTLLARDANGCETMDEITVFVDKTRKVFIPNAFSPNGDGYNDYFTIYGGIDVEEIVSFHIFDRWGGLVFSNKNFQPNDELIGWNGFFDGKKVAGGVYVYTTEILFKDGLVERFSGDLTIIEN